MRPNFLLKIKSIVKKSIVHKTMIGNILSTLHR
jgi:hypothetical protein